MIPGFALVGIAQGTILLARAAAADMYPPERRARGISYVLLGALFGAALGPLVFRPLFAGKDLDTDALVVPWIAAAGIMVVGSCSCSRPARPPQSRSGCTRAGGSELEERRRWRAPAPAGRDHGPRRRRGELRGMVAVMNLAGYVVIDHGHHQSDVFT